MRTHTNTATYLPGLKPVMAGLKLHYHAAQIGVDPSFLSQLVNCKRGASLSMALRLAAYFHVSVEQIATDPDAAPSLSPAPENTLQKCG